MVEMTVRRQSSTHTCPNLSLEVKGKPGAVDLGRGRGSTIDANLPACAPRRVETGLFGLERGQSTEVETRRGGKHEMIKGTIDDARTASSKENAIPTRRCQ